jgi:PAS domain S-box-containing protein
MSQETILRGELNTGRGREEKKDEERSRLLALLDERLRFETLISRLSTTFIHLPAEEVDSEIERGLQQIVEFLDIDRSSLAQFSAERKQLHFTHSYAVPGFPSFPPIITDTQFPWYTERIRRGESVRMVRLPDDLPPEAAAERAYCIGVDFKSHLSLPLQVGGSVLGVVAFGSFRREFDWPDDLVQSLQLVGEIFANALARKRAELALRASEGRFRLMADTAPVMVWMSGPDQGCTYFNKHWLDFTGRPLQQQLGDGWSEGVHPDDLPRCLDTYRRAFDARQEFRMEYRLQRFDGEYRWILDTGVPRFAPGGSCEGYIGSCIDITDEKRAEEALRESEARLRLLLESTHAIPWVADAQSWRFTYIGPQASKLFGYPADAWYEPDFWADHLHPEDREAALAFCREHSQGQTDYQFEYRMVAAAGRILWIHDIVNVVAENGTPRMLRGFMIDVTARRQAEEELRNVREQLMHVGRVTLMGELAASIAHEVNQPLCAIVSNAQTVQRMLASGGFDLEEMGEALRDISQDGQRASAVLARIRGFLQKAPAERAPVDVNALLREVSILMRSEMARRGVTIKLELDEKLPAVLGDRVQLQQVILNLLANGADAMDGVARELVLHSTVGEMGIAVAVQDAGVGLDPRTSGRIFDAFFTTKPGGTGMGLALCKSIIEAHGGRIWARPNAERGTTFQFTLPLQEVPS